MPSHINHWLLGTVLRGEWGFNGYLISDGDGVQNGEPPAMTTFVAGPDWKQYTFPFPVFETDGSDVSGIGFMKVGRPGKVQFELDQVEIK